MFLCPICNRQLASAANPGVVEIFATEDDSPQERVHVSRIAGVHATFLCGPHAAYSVPARTRPSTKA